MYEVLEQKLTAIKEWVRSIPQYMITAKPSKDGYDQVEGRKVQPGEQQYDQPVRRFANYGFRSLPPTGSESVALSINGAVGNKIQIASENIKYGPDDLQEGEVSIFSKFGNNLQRFTTNGDIVFNRGTKQVARVDDRTDSGLLEGFVVPAAMVTPGSLQLFYTPKGGTRVTILDVKIPGLTGVGGSSQVLGQIFTGAPHLLA